MKKRISNVISQDPLHFISIAIILGFGLVIGYNSLTRHQIGDYGVETDFYGDYAPAAEDLLEGRLDIVHYRFRGPGYPFLLALLIPITGDAFLAARLLALMSALTVLGCAYYLLNLFSGRTWGLWGVIALASNGLFQEYAFRAGTDMPFAALCALLITSLHRPVKRRPGLWSSAQGALAGFIALTRYNGALMIIPVLIKTLIDHRTGTRQSAVKHLLPVLGGWLLIVLPWSSYLLLQTGNPFYSLNYRNVEFEFRTDGEMIWDEFWYPDSSSTPDTNVAPNQWQDIRHYLLNLPRHFALDLDQVVGGALGWLVPVGLIWLLLNPVDLLRMRWNLISGAALFLPLGLVFYRNRFTLPLLFIYYNWITVFLSRWGVKTQPRRWKLAVTPVWILAAVLAVWGLPGRVQHNLTLMAQGPVEILELKKHPAVRELPPGVLTARKPHSAYITGNDFIPLPNFVNVNSLRTWMSECNLSYLFANRREAMLRPLLWKFLHHPTEIEGFKCIYYKSAPREIGLWRRE